MENNPKVIFTNKYRLQSSFFWSLSRPRTVYIDKSRQKLILKFLNGRTEELNISDIERVDIISGLGYGGIAWYYNVRLILKNGRKIVVFSVLWSYSSNAMIARELAETIGVPFDDSDRMGLKYEGLGASKTWLWFWIVLIFVCVVIIWWVY